MGKFVNEYSKVRKIQIFRFMIAPTKLVRRFASRRLETKTIVRTFASPEEALSFFDSNTQLSVNQLEPILSQLSFIQHKANVPAEDLFSDDRFTRLILQISSDANELESPKLLRIAQAISSLSLPRGGSAEITELARKVGELVCNRPNAYSPSDIAHLAFSLGSRGYADPVFVDFVRMEAMKMVQDFTPESGVMILEAFRRMNVFNRELVDNVVERLTDEVDRFRSKDIVNCVTVFSKLGLGRGFLLRRLSKLSFENLNLFSQSQLVRLLSGFARLRFITTAGTDALLNAIESNGISKLAPNLVTETLFASAMTNYKGESLVLDKLVDSSVERVEILSLTSMVDFAWALCVLDDSGKYADILESVSKKIFAISPPSNKQILLKALEIVPCVDADLVSAQWKSAMDDAEKMEMARFEGARLHSEMLALIESIKPSGMIKEKLAVQRNATVNGMFRVDFFDEQQQIAIDIDTLSRPTTMGLKHRLLGEQGVATCCVGYWDIRKLKTFDDQQEFLRVLINKALRSRC